MNADNDTAGTPNDLQALGFMQQGLHIISDQARYPVRHQLGQAAAGQRHHGRPGRQRLQRHDRARVSA